MCTQVLAFVLLATSVIGADVYSPVHDFGAMLRRGNAILKRQGYYPTTQICGQGATCAEACGAAYAQCPSDASVYCYDPNVGDHCCTDGTGNSCSAGYYCTTDGEANTYCCPNDLDTASCEVAYSLTVSLIRENSTIGTPTSSLTRNIPIYTSVSTTPIHVSCPTATGTLYTGRNGSYTIRSPLLEYTGAAARAGGGVLAVLRAMMGLTRFL